MPTLTIRNVNEDVRDFLRKQAAEHGHSMEAEVRAILEEVKRRGTTRPSLVAQRIRAHFSEIDSSAVKQPPRPPAPEPVDLG